VDNDLCLVLNSSLEPLNITTLQRAVRLLYTGKAEVVHDNGKLIGSPTFQMRLPTVIRLLYYIVRKPRPMPLTKKNVLLRDEYACQYCGRHTEHEAATVDHVTPRSRGGRSTFENLVCCCSPCNARKKDRLPSEAGMQLRRKPRRPFAIPWLVVTRNTGPFEWGLYLGLYGVRIEERAE
jgi:5-methylcytosine-specific restriction endonuclease McrA